MYKVFRISEIIRRAASETGKGGILLIASVDDTIFYVRLPNVVTESASVIGRKNMFTRQLSVCVNDPFPTNMNWSVSPEYCPWTVVF